MCLAIPTQIKELLPEQRAMVNLGGVEQEISTALIEELAEGDYVIVHVGFALNRLDPDEAAETLRMLAQMAELAEEDRG